MEERHDRSLRIGRPVYFGNRSGDHWVRDSHDIGRVGRDGCHALALLGKVTNRALGVMTPLAVTTQALTVVGTLQPRLLEGVRVVGSAVTLLAGRNSAGRREMVTGLTVRLHFRHSRMDLVVEMHWAIEIGDLIQNHYRWGFCQLMLDPFLVGDTQCGTWLEAHVFGGRFRASMALQAVEFWNVLFQCLGAADAC